MSINQKLNSLFRHFGESLAVKIGAAAEKTVTGIFNDATTATESNRADAITTLPHVVFAGSDVLGIGTNDTVKRGAKTYYVIDRVGDSEILTVYISEDRA